MTPVFLEKISIHNDWQQFLTMPNLNLLAKIEQQVLVQNYTPAEDKVLRFLEFPLRQAKIIILGQDPYPQKGVATGRAFEVGNLKSWDDSFRNTSLKNILRALYRADHGEIIKYNFLKEKLGSDFPVLPPGELFSHWEKQGVLLLNTSFTCEIGSPGSHSKTWSEFTNRLLTYINKTAPKVIWFLWGNHAIKATGHLKIKKKISTMHPMMCYDIQDRKRDFLYGDINCFELCSELIDWTGCGKSRPLG